MENALGCGTPGSACPAAGKDGELEQVREFDGLQVGDLEEVALDHPVDSGRATRVGRRLRLEDKLKVRDDGHDNVLWSCTAETSAAREASVECGISGDTSTWG